MLWSGMPAAAARVPLELREVARNADGLSLSVRLPDSLPEELQAQLKAGARVQVTFEAQVEKPRTFWFDAELARRLVELSVSRHAESGVFTLERRVDGKLEDAFEVRELEEAERFLTQLSLDVPLAARHAGKRMRYKVRAVLQQKLKLLFVPTTVKSKWQRGRVPEPEPEPAS
ncbi:MAG: DUF4390 domain-containing protein [Acidobacteriota bacterium]